MDQALSKLTSDCFYTGEHFQNYFKVSPQSVVFKANFPDFTILAVSDQFIDMSLKSRTELLGKNLLDVLPGKIKDDYGKGLALSTLKEMLRTKKKIELPIYIYDIYSSETGKLEPLYWSNSYQPVLDEDGNVAYIINTTANVTAQVMLKEMASTSAENLLQQQQRLHKMFMKAPIGMALYTKGNFIIEYANEAICKLWGKGGPLEVLGQSIFDLLPSMLEFGYREIFEEVISSGQSYQGRESPVKYERDGVMEIFYFDLNLEPVFGKGQEVTGLLSVVNNVTGRVLTRKTIENTEERLRLASEATGIASWDLDLQSMELIYSPSLADLFGIPGKTDLTFEELRELVYPEDIIGVKEAFQTALDSGKYNRQSRIVRPDHLIYWISVTGKVIFNANGTPARMLGTVMDITESKQEELKKNDFIAIASHELKTPLTSLKAYAQLLKSSKAAADPNFIKSVGARIEGQINKMTKLVYSFLDLSKIETNKTELSTELIDVNELIKEVINDYVFQEKNHPILFDAESLPMIYADKHKITQVIDNLVSNAIKYSPLGGDVLVSAKLQNEVVLISVEDHGIGIDNIHQHKIFDRYYRIDDMQVKNASGFGIGLYLCADIVERHHGEIGLKSEPGKGSRFFFTLPVDAPSKIQ
ncbi:PAS domain-containing sensor histidine kinase [Pedobacter gandavensis]|uniref:histidine kinase n=1 Tax=Pedobacter gandavensis TaxID=2679963 RepID=A0ABR6EV15_9SPHI|nr:PAS domain-containing sensor histidine kinase [Pedobacter gandavensis]MBB2149032.1 PAS domain-containing protein [Pedobacter gandavensis]